ncbi:DNA-3-methyladenine glycosylase I [Oenococcus oeni]|uniref:3-methyladenine DNA glycosylase n=1 Tax=Oenococcus oeni ATCC BAA-1163 TaxID=379360 RepID=A0NLB0_OENOE|nr:DNA-3-methyladenine glycosylase I [Oenococcus oeni]EAV38781.1 3-methyladenine DNA glycosylase [Oenococcus oeni ATCC BAA-1163]EJO02284.1 DNA-3-methyladenine glycosylase I [Oenococcus oeni AWRIB418]KDE87579.1 3-methyladenine DNA glycosylase [Oenococcus oeni]KEP88156.1 3-methyladenine DNA glycosylase [Oenococcus oeni IOEB_0501]KMQ37626.1 3-methyladenine DNA glycosylase [Oenococcus oeni]
MHNQQSALLLNDQKKRCAWVSEINKPSPEMILYHDLEWGRPSHDDRYLFELLCLETYQAGLSWAIVLKKRDAFRRAFFNFEIKRVAEVTSIENLLLNKDIIRNRMKLSATVNNAKIFLKIEKEYGSFADYLWHFTNGKTIDNHVLNYADIPSENQLSINISKQMKKTGFKFTGPVTIYSYLQAVGIINDHQIDCQFNPDSI